MSGIRHISEFGSTFFQGGAYNLRTLCGRLIPNTEDARLTDGSHSRGVCKVCENKQKAEHRHCIMWDCEQLRFGGLLCVNHIRAEKRLIMTYKYCPELWDQKYGIWPSNRILIRRSIDRIKSALPCGPISLAEAESYAMRFRVNPKAIFQCRYGVMDIYHRLANMRTDPDPALIRARQKEKSQKRQTLMRKFPKLPPNFHAERWESQERKCYHCSRSLDKPEHLDHLIPLSRGGTHTPDNLVASCARCNLQKREKTAKEFAKWRLFGR